jgi:hypothetical protein
MQKNKQAMVCSSNFRMVSAAACATIERGTRERNAELPNAIFLEKLDPKRLRPQVDTNHRRYQKLTALLEQQFLGA